MSQDSKPLLASRSVVIFLAGALAGAIAAVEIVPNYSGRTSAADTQQTAGAVDSGVVDGGAIVGGGVVAAGGDAGITTGGGATSQAGGSLPAARTGLVCAANRNGGATDQGVTGTQIHMATTVVESGIGAAFLRDVRFAMEAVRNETNRTGGICGRQLTIDYIDDGWDAQKGQQFIRNFMGQVFAIPVGPSSEGLRVVISSGDVDRARIPVVGADGMLIDQYSKPDGSPQPWVWAVASSTVASARIMAQNARKAGAKSFGIVFDKNYRFGQEAARAFNAEVKRILGEPVEGFNEELSCRARFCGIQAGQSSYPNEIREFYRAPVDFTALFLEPQTALTWMTDPNSASARTRRYGGAQPLFTRDFAVNCQTKCDQMTVWTGFKPYIESYKSDPAVQKYVSDLKRTSPQADEFNAFVVGAYVGMRLLVQALKQTGPELTRARLKAVLDRTTLQTGLTLQDKLTWAPGLRYVNTTMQGFTIQFKGTFGGWREGSIEVDPRPTAGTA